MQRREFLIASSMAAALSLASRAGGGIVGSGAPSSILAIVYEPRCQAACEVAHHLMESGARAFAANECMVRLWRGPLPELLNRGEPRIAGVTLYSDFEIARDCARERGLRVLHEDWYQQGPVALVSWLAGT